MALTAFKVGITLSIRVIAGERATQGEVWAKALKIAEKEVGLLGMKEHCNFIELDDHAYDPTDPDEVKP